jgi:curli biogenesis system outer membrane secretion channel CsgG
MKQTGFFLVSIIFLVGCSPVGPVPKPTKLAVMENDKLNEQPAASGMFYKRKIAIARFNNETNYGRALLSDAAYGQLGKQTSDMLAARLIRSGKFLVYERADLIEPTPVGVRADITVRDNPPGNAQTGGQEKSQAMPSFEQKVRELGVPGVDTLIIGSVTEFGRHDVGKGGFLSSSKVQTARAKVEARLIDVRSGQAYFSISGTGEASTATGEVAGFGSRASYDATLNDRALGAAISDMLSDLVSRLEQRPWQCAVLKIDAGQVYISGGAHQQVKVGDTFQVMQYGEKVRNSDTGRDIQLPGQQAARIEVVSLFGSEEFNEGAACKIIAGACDPGKTADYYVTEAK